MRLSTCALGQKPADLAAPLTRLGCSSRVALTCRHQNGTAPKARRSSLSIVTQALAVDLETPPARASPAISVTRPLWFSNSGQPASQFHGAPLTGRPEPLGATPEPASASVNFSVYSANASAVSLVLFTEGDLVKGKATHEVALDPVLNRTGDVWHVMLPQIRPGLLYGYRVSGPSQEDGTPESKGQRFDKSKVVLDPYAQAVIGRRRYCQLGAELAYGQAGTLGLARTWPQAACAVPATEQDSFDWQGDRPLNLPMEQLVVYEMHVRGFTQHESSGASAPGTYAGMVERLDYLKGLGINAVELLPVQEFNELEYYAPIPGATDGAHRVNFWGYSTVGYFAPMSRFSDAVAKGGDGRSLGHEFKTLVRECHKRGIEVILDVVFNHTAEGNEKGVTLSFRGLDNRIYYMMAPGGEYYNYSGCGNTFNCNEPAVRQFIVDCLRYWVTEYHVDGFRFDLASILTRAPAKWHPQQHGEEGEALALHGDAPPNDGQGLMADGAGVPTGTPLADPPLVELISEDPVLRHTKMIAEAWDCDGLNQVGAFPHYSGRWSEWNGRFRDTVRNFIKGSEGPWAGAFAAAMCGSPNIYADTTPVETDWWGSNTGRKWKGGRGPTASVNFVTAHDGFTLADLVAYNEKHNELNGEENRDGESHNSSWNCGEEGPSERWDVRRLRQRQMRNMVMALLLAHGVPMLCMGDEYGHSKGGNNNSYCHDNALNWLDWEQLRRDEAGLARFVRLLIHFRRSRPELQRASYVTDKDITWHGELPNTPDWTDASRLVAYTLSDGQGGGLYVAFNTAHVPRQLTLPKWEGRVWRLLADTGKVAPYDFVVPDEELSPEEVERARAAASMWTAEHCYSLLPWSALLLESVPEEETHTLRAKPAASARGAEAGGRPGAAAAPATATA